MAVWNQTGRYELVLNPDGFIGESDKEICSTLVHEQHHVWQHVIGTAPKRGYHDREWAAKMKANGLQPSSTGMVGGRETGQHMDHYVIPGGRFEQAYDKLAASNRRIGLARRKGRARRPSSPVRVVASRMFGASRIAASTVTTARLACGRQLRSYHQRGSLPWRFASTRRPCQHPPRAEAWS